MPAADRLGGERRFLEAQPQQCLKSFRIVASPGENKTARRRIEPRRMFKQPPIMMRDEPQAMRNIAAKAACPRIAAKSGEALEDILILWQTLRLLICDHLQPVFDFAQEKIGRAQVRDRLARDPAFLAE